MDIELWRQRKKEMHLTLDDIAERSGVSRGTVARLFSKTSGYNNPCSATVEVIERVLELTDDYSHAPDPPLTEAQRRIIKAFNSLIPPMQDYVLEMVEKLVDSQSAKRS